MRTAHSFLVVAMALGGLACAAPAAEAPPVPAASAPELTLWTQGGARDAIEDFVARVTDPTGADFVPAAERIAVFDNDGALWAEQPLYFQAIFAVEQMRQAAEADAELAAKEPYRTILDEGLAGLAGVDAHDLLGPLVESHGGATEAEFAVTAAEWLATARHPTLDRPYTELTYAPMVELLGYLRAHGFQTWIVTGGGVSFVRVFSEAAYGIPPQQVVGSRLKLEFEMTENGPVIQRRSEIAFIDDGPGKPVGIATQIGRKPIFAWGNSDGDLQMLQYTDDGDGPSMSLYLHHDDADREWAYDRESSVGRLDAGLDEAAARGWTVVSMRNDWTTVFGER
jgi:phosphoserine phosphatase